MQKNNPAKAKGRPGSEWMDATLLPSAVFLVLIFFAFEFTGTDLAIQDGFYNFQTHSWIIDAKDRLPRLIFYSGPKALIWMLAITALAAAIFYNRLPFRKISRRDLVIVVLTVATAPALVAMGKATTNTFTPAQVRRYGGEVPYVKVIGRYPEGDRPAKRGRAFPAGHACGGFALLSLAGLAASRRGRATGIAIGIAAGCAMGLYQMLKGAHYLSHTLVTGAFCWIVFLAWRRMIPGIPAPSRPPALPEVK